VVAEYVKRNADVLQADRQARMLFCNRGNVHPGDVVRNEALAESIRAIRKEGPNVFYSGRIAESIVRTLRSLGSPMTLGDLASHRTESPAPVRMPWRDLEICAHPPNSQGVVAPLVQCMLEGDAAEPQAQWMHLAIEAFKLAFEERDSRIGDPETTKPIDDLLAPTMIAYLRSRIDPTRAAIRQLAPQEGGTVAIVCVDADGRAISLIQSLFMGFGSGIVAEGTGIFLHNRGAYFSLEPGHPNELHGGKRPLHTLSPAMALKNGRPFLVYGTMGGDGQPQTQVQLLHNILERGMNVQEAIDAPRFVYGRDSESQFVDNVRIESRFDAETISLLRARGHKVIQLQPFDHAAGHAQVIQIDEARGSMAGGADPRADSAALPL
ncbi:MAG TPA: gamma-glutamyltransferase, partial [Candidatus Baltobacteraceae bacterium]|nr:gamma-glutamyltransferase [Candidatus Baltobacteraceae bacterium]